MNNLLCLVYRSSLENAINTKTRLCAAGIWYRQNFSCLDDKAHRTASFRLLPALKRGTFVGAMVIFSLVRGFMPTLPLRVETWKIPNPVNDTLPPFCSSRVTASRTESTISPTTFFDWLVFYATASTTASLFLRKSCAD